MAKCHEPRIRAQFGQQIVTAVAVDPGRVDSAAADDDEDGGEKTREIRESDVARISTIPTSQNVAAVGPITVPMATSAPAKLTPAAILSFSISS